MKEIVIKQSEIFQCRADVLLPPHREFAESYRSAVRAGLEIAAQSSVMLVAICRNAMPWLPQTLDLVASTGSLFRDWSAFIYENDSRDDTKEVLKNWEDGEQRKAVLCTHNRPYLNGTIATERTVALAEYRAACQDEVRRRGGADYVIVFDADPWGGWSPSGVATSLYWLNEMRYDVMASYSYSEMEGEDGKPCSVHYDAFAARLNHWTHGSVREQTWFHHWRPRIGSPPVRFNSAFGQLAVYRGDVYLRGRYSGEDCEHVTFHRSLNANLALNPSSRCVSFWVPGHGGQHRED